MSDATSFVDLTSILFTLFWLFFIGLCSIFTGKVSERAGHYSSIMGKPQEGWEAFPNPRRIAKPMVRVTG